MRDLAFVFVLCAGVTCLALASPTAAEASTGATRSIEAVQLRISLEGHDIGLLIPVGSSAEITDHRRNTTLRFEPSIQAGLQNQSGNKQVALVVLQSLADGSQTNLVDVALLSEGGPPRTIPTASLEVRLTKVLDLEVPNASGPNGPQDFEMLDCCVTCNGVTTCAFCVTTPCGRCCAG